MVQESIVDYINSQMKLGVSRDAVKTTLVGAGWAAADVEDTLKKVEVAKPAAQPVAMAATPAKPAEFVAAKPLGATGPGPQTIRVSDLVSSSASPAPMTMSSKPAAASPVSTSKSPLTGPAASTAGAAVKSPNTFQAQTFSAAKPHGSRGALITDIVLVVIILAVGGFAGFLYMQNGSLSSKLDSLNGTSSGVNSQLSALTAQVAASTTALTAQVATLTGDNQELRTELSFLVAPTGTTPGASTTGTFSGIVSAGKTSYIITASYGTKISVANSKSASVISALAELMAPVTAATSTTASSTATSTVASSTATSTAPVVRVTPATAQFTGTYIPGSDSITLTEVNGTSL